MTGPTALSRLATIADTLTRVRAEATDLEGERIALIRFLAGDGYALSGIAVAAGVTRQRIHQLLNQEG